MHAVRQNFKLTCIKPGLIDPNWRGIGPSPDLSRTSVELDYDGVQTDLIDQIFLRNLRFSWKDMWPVTGVEGETGLELIVEVFVTGAFGAPRLLLFWVDVSVGLTVTGASDTDAPAILIY